MEVAWELGRDGFVVCADYCLLCFLFVNGWDGV